MYLRNIARLEQRNNVIRSMYAATTEYPPLSHVFFDNDTVIGESQPDAAFVSMGLVWSRPRTVDDDIGMPLNQPIGTKDKISFYNYGNLYKNYYKQQNYGK
ncbi:unnamed protein product [Caenorhabditis bovis]|uniref:Uncharacterized protein n=1 Tax=Caenorhabditis bovis TaxID=2654633 RepID=A0A8S1FEM0_9PELO|nr:unnamed protein product [Caenorhabditis bovis]